MKSNFFKSSAILFVGDLLTKILGFIYLAPLARIDGGIGTIQGYLMTPYSFFVIFSVMGITNVMMYKLGPVKDDPKMYKKHFLDGAFYVAITSTIITILLIVFARPLMESVTPAGIEYLDQLVISLRIIAISIIFYGFNTLIRALMLSKNYVTIISITYITEQLVKLILLLVGCYYLISVKENNVAISSYVTALAVTLSVISTSLIVLMYALKTKVFSFLNSSSYRWKPSSFKAIFVLGSVYFVNNVFISGFSQIDLAMMASGLTRAGYDTLQIELITGVYFTWSWKLIMVVITLGAVFVTIMIKQMTQTKKEDEKLQELKNVMQVLILYSLLATVFFVTAGIDFYRFFYGTNIGVSILIAQSILVLPIMLRMQISVFSITVGHRRVVLFSTLLIFATKIVLNPILFNFFEVYGYILSSLIACIVSISYMIIFDAKLFKFTKEDFAQILSSFFKMAIVLVVSVIFAVYVRGLIESNIMRFIVISGQILIVFALANIKTLISLKDKM